MREVFVGHTLFNLAAVVACILVFARDGRLHDVAIAPELTHFLEGRNVA